MPEHFNGDGPAYLVGNDTRGGTSSTPDSYSIEGAGGYIVRGSTGWGPNATISFAFRSTAPSSMPDDTSGFSQFNATQIAQTLLALQSWSDVANINFTRVGSGYSNDATMLFSNYSDGSDGAAAFAYYPGSTASSSVSGDAWFNIGEDYNATPVYLGYGRHTLTHEIGHALGLDHPGDYNAGEGGPITYANSATYREDSRQYTVMSYFEESATGANHGGFYASAPLLDDITAVQLLYGANMTTRTGNTTYGFNSNTGRDFYTIGSASDKVIFAVWDAGGVDTLDFSGYTQTQTIDLRAGEFSSVGGLTYNVAIAQGAFIEKGIGGSASDTMYASYFQAATAVADITKAQGTSNHTTGSAVSLNGKFGLAFDNAIVSSTVIPHATVNAVGDGSRDYYAVTVKAGQQITIDIDGTASALDAFVSIVTSNGTVLAFNDDGMTDIGSGKQQDSYLSYTFTSAGTFYIAVGSFPADYEEGDVVTIGDAIGAGQAYTVNVSLTGATAPTTGPITGSDLDGRSGDDILYGNIGNDVLRGGIGIDSMRGGKGDDVYYVDNIADSLVEAKGEGTDLAYSSVSYVLRAGIYVENLTLTGTNNINGTGNGLDNILTGNSGINILSGGKGNDTYYVQNAGDVLVEAKSDGTDTAYSSVSFVLAAGVYVENLTLTGSSDINATGNGIANVLTGNSGINVLAGGKGNDTYYVQNTGDTIVEAKSQGTDLVYSSATFELKSGVYIENLTLTGSSSINATGNGIDNVIRGNSGANVINGGGGSDTLYGGAGNDTLNGGSSGADQMYGGAGDDIYVVNSSGDKAFEVNGEGADLVQSSASYSLTGQYIENLTLTGSKGIYAKGNTLDNILIGNSGANKINGMQGQDTLTGGGGADTFIWDATSHSKVGASDLITDLSNSDFIDLSRIDANTKVSGVQHFSLVDAFTNTAGQVTLTYNAGTDITSLHADTNGDGVADMLIRIAGDHDDFDNFIFGG